MATWNDVPADLQAKVTEALRINAAKARVQLSGPVTISAEGAELVVPGEAV